MMPASEQLHSINYGKESILFSLSFSQRKTLSITVYPDLFVTVMAPEGAAIEKVNQRIHKRASWILKQKDYFSQFLAYSNQANLSERRNASISRETIQAENRERRRGSRKAQERQILCYGKPDVFPANRNAAR